MIMLTNTSPIQCSLIPMLPTWPGNEAIFDGDVG